MGARHPAQGCVQLDAIPPVRAAREAALAVALEAVLVVVGRTAPTTAPAVALEVVLEPARRIVPTTAPAPARTTVLLFVAPTVPVLVLSTALAATTDRADCSIDEEEKYMIIQKKIKVEPQDVVKVRREFFEETGLRITIEYMKKNYGDSEEFSTSLSKYEKEYAKKHRRREEYAREFFKSRIGDKKILSYVFYFEEGEAICTYEEEVN